MYVKPFLELPSFILKKGMGCFPLMIVQMKDFVKEIADGLVLNHFSPKAAGNSKRRNSNIFTSVKEIMWLLIWFIS